MFDKPIFSSSLSQQELFEKMILIMYNIISYHMLIGKIGAASRLLLRREAKYSEFTGFT